LHQYSLFKDVEFQDMLKQQNLTNCTNKYTVILVQRIQTCELYQQQETTHS